jgi:hypothetical protein
MVFCYNGQAALTKVMVHKMTSKYSTWFNTVLLRIIIAGTVLSATASFGATVWGYPSKSKPLDVLCIGPEIGLNDFANLARQFPMKLTSVGIQDNLHPILVNQKDESLNAVLENNASKDLVVLANVHPQGLSRETITTLRQLIDDGMNVIWVRFDSEMPESLESVLSGASDETTEVDEELSRGLVRNWGSLVDDQTIRLGTIGDGRLLDILINAPAPMFHNLLPDIALRSIVREAEYDNVWSFYVRAVRWMLGVEPATKIQRLVDLTPKGPDPIDTPPQLPREFVQATIDSAMQVPIRTFNVYFSNPLPKKFDLEVQIRFPDRNINWRYPWGEPLRKGAEFASVLIPVGLGDSWVDIFLKDGDNVVDWYTHRSFVKGWPEIDNVKFPRFIVQPNDSYEVTFDVREQIETPNGGQISRNDFVYALLRATDSYGRVIGETQQKLDLTNDTQSVVLNWTNALGEFIQLDLFLDEVMQGKIGNWHEEQGAHAEAPLLIQQPDTETPFYVAMDGVTVNQPNNLARLNELSRNRLGYLVVDTRFPYGPGALLHDLDQIPKAPFFRFDPSIPVDRWLMIQQSHEVREHLLDRLLPLIQEQKLYRQSLLYVDDVEILKAIQRAESISDEDLVYQFVQWLQTRYTDLSQVGDRWDIELEYWSDVHRASENAGKNSMLVQDIRAFLLVRYVSMLQEFFRIFRDELDTVRLVVASETFVTLNELGADTSYLEPFSTMGAEIPKRSHIIVAEKDLALWAEPSLQLWHYFIKGARGVWFQSATVGGISATNVYWNGKDGLDDTIQEVLTTHVTMNDYLFPLMDTFNPLFMGKGLPGIHTKNKFTGTRYDFEHEGRTISAWLPELGNPYDQKKVSIEAPKKMFVYDMSSGEMVAPGKKGNFDNSSKAPLWVSSLPYGISRLLVDSPKKITGGARVPLSITLRTTEKLPGDHWIHFQVRGPDGKILRHYSQTIFCPSGQGETVMQMALNEMAGRYELEFRDILTGVATTKTIDVLGVPRL